MLGALFDGEKILFLALPEPDELESLLEGVTWPRCVDGLDNNATPRDLAAAVAALGAEKLVFGLTMEEALQSGRLGELDFIVDVRRRDNSGRAVTHFLFAGTGVCVGRADRDRPGVIVDKLGNLDVYGAESEGVISLFRVGYEIGSRVVGEDSGVVVADELATAALRVLSKEPDAAAAEIWDAQLSALAPLRAIVGR